MDNILLVQNGIEFTNPRLSPMITSSCMQGVLAAYDDYTKGTFTTPTGYIAVARFTGWDTYFHAFAEEEKFGLVFRSTINPSVLIIAIRGTSSMLDAYEDLWATKVNFKPFEPKVPFPDNVGVASGFNSIYASKGGSMSRTMQQQIFNILSDTGSSITDIIVTGHSLGSALCSLLALDLVASLPNINVYNYNFASPRVGGETWQATYQKKFDLESRTFRITNYYDYVPSLPPEILGYAHVGMNFLISFYVKDAWVPHPVCRHSMKNYQAVLSKAIYQNPQHWYGEFKDLSSPDSTYTMVSAAPPTLEVPEWSEVYRLAEEQVIGQLS